MSDNVSGMNPVAKMGFVPRGIYDNTVAYDFLDFVYYSGNTYVAKKITVGNEPQENNEYWQILAKGGIENVGIQFQVATERQNIQSGEDAPTLFGKIKKWYTDLKEVAWSGNYIDLSNKPTIPAAVAVKGNVESAYRTGNVNLTPANIGAVATSKVLTTKEQINANTDTSNVAGATAVKAMVSEINGNFEIVRTEVDSISDLWNLIPRRPFIILRIRGGTNLFGQDGNYIGALFMEDGNYVGIMINHWTGKTYAVTGTTYIINDMHFTPIS